MVFVPRKQHLFILKLKLCHVHTTGSLNHRDQYTVLHLSDEGGRFLDMVLQFDSSLTAMGCSDVHSSLIPPSVHRGKEGHIVWEHFVLPAGRAV